MISIKGCVQGLITIPKAGSEGKSRLCTEQVYFLLNSNRLDFTNSSYNCFLVSGQGLQSGICWYVNIKKKVLYPRATVPPTLSIKCIWLYLQWSTKHISQQHASCQTTQYFRFKPILTTGLWRDTWTGLEDWDAVVGNRLWNMLPCQPNPQSVRVKCKRACQSKYRLPSVSITLLLSHTLLQ